MRAGWMMTGTTFWMTCTWTCWRSSTTRPCNSQLACCSRRSTTKTVGPQIQPPSCPTSTRRTAVWGGPTRAPVMTRARSKRTMATTPPHPPTRWRGRGSSPAARTPWAAATCPSATSLSFRPTARTPTTWGSRWTSASASASSWSSSAR
uniref:Alternative protein PDZRN3 n=1 Tax=Homo sapiens TaxID=9606 RepID=L8E852_HUMAN|nr:alternative protein PDZRN3 [Homo sapiens]